MNRINNCQACNNEKNGVKTRLLVAHTCGKMTLLNTTKGGDSGYIGQELLDGMSEEFHLNRTCEIIEEFVNDGIFTLEEALGAYSVTEEQYNNYLKKLK